jgi:two-component system CheB/CheR fusion protein
MRLPVNVLFSSLASGQGERAIRDDVSPQRLARFFSAHEHHYQVNQAIRDMVLFARHDVVLDPPFTKLDLIACRNRLIYFGPLLQRRLLPLIHYSLRPGGVLFLGSSETVGRFNHLFTRIQSRLRFYLRQDHAFVGGSGFLLESSPPLSGPSKEHAVSPPDVPARPTDALQAAAEQVLLQVYAPAAVVLNGDGDIVYISGHTGKYLEPAAGKANWNIFARAREGLRAPLAGALKKAATKNAPVHLHRIAVSTPGGSQRVDVTVQAFHDASPLRGMTMIVFRDLAPGTAGWSRRRGKGAGPALHLAELQAKLDDLALAQSDMQNVLNSIEIAILFLDQNLNVRRYTDRAAKIVRLRESDIGRPLSDLTTKLQYPALHDDARETLRTLVFSEKQIATDDRRWFTVRIMPYRRLDNVIDGVVITLVDITDTKQLESALRQQSTP